MDKFLCISKKKSEVPAFASTDIRMRQKKESVTIRESKAGASDNPTKGAHKTTKEGEDLDGGEKVECFEMKKKKKARSGNRKMDGK